MLPAWDVAGFGPKSQAKQIIRLLYEALKELKPLPEGFFIIEDAGSSWLWLAFVLPTLCIALCIASRAMAGRARLPTRCPLRRLPANASPEGASAAPPQGASASGGASASTATPPRSGMVTPESAHSSKRSASPVTVAVNLSENYVSRGCKEFRDVAEGAVFFAGLFFEGDELFGSRPISFAVAVVEGN